MRVECPGMAAGASPLKHDRRSEAEGVVRLIRMRAGCRCIQVSIAAVVTISLTIVAYESIKSTCRATPTHSRPRLTSAAESGSSSTIRLTD